MNIRFIKCCIRYVYIRGWYVRHHTCELSEYFVLLDGVHHVASHVVSYQVGKHLDVVSTGTVSLCGTDIDVVSFIEVVLQGYFREQLYIVMAEFSLIVVPAFKRLFRYHGNFFVQRL